MSMNEWACHPCTYPPRPTPLHLIAGTPSTTTAYYYNVYRADGTRVGNLNALKADSGTATGSTAPTTPSGGTAYSSYTSNDILTFSTGDLKAATATQLTDGFYQVGFRLAGWGCAFGAET